MPRKIIIDTDPGVDDTMAIFFALCSPELEVVGLTSIFGNVHTALATKNALRLLEIAGRADIPVAHGADDALTGISRVLCLLYMARMGRAKSISPILLGSH